MFAQEFILKWNDMQSPRRFLPSTSLLQAFETAARTGSITAAARELSLTQSAVSRQIMALEEQLGVKLFHRERQTIRLTLGGDAYAREIRDALRRISSASLNLRANPFGGTLNLASLPTFGTRWLTPRLPAFMAQNPGVSINLLTRMTRFDFRLEPFDAAIHFGGPEWPGADLVLLRHEVVLPVCSPEFKGHHRFARAEDARQVPLLHLTTRPDAWERWLAHHGAPSEGVHGMLFDQFSALAQAAVSGLGLALLPDFLIAEELQSGKLVTALDLPLQSADSYYLAWPAERGSYAPLVAFREWIIAATAPDR